MDHTQEYIKILKEELVVAMGCTEPIAIAYCASLVRETLGALPREAEVLVSGNILKNVKSVIVPNTGKQSGIKAAVAVGFLAGDSKKELEVLAGVTEEQQRALPGYMDATPMTIDAADTDHALYIEITGHCNKERARVILTDAHTHIALIEKNGEVLYQNNEDVRTEIATTDKSVLNVADILQFAEAVDLEEVKKILDRQIKYNMAIAEEGMQNPYGANIGKTLLKCGEGGIMTTCKALAGAASDARMNGCEMPVVINSGSGNQGITCSVPVIAYARHKGLPTEKLYRALLISNLITIHIKNNIGKLSAFCGVVIAGVGCGAGICYLDGGTDTMIVHTIVNALAINSGVVCDGAKSSCAAKIASSVEAGFLGYYMYKEGNQFYGGEGIVKKGVENTIKAVGELARVGMCETDKEIIHIMLD